MFIICGYLVDQSRSSGRLVFPGWRQDSNSSVVSGQSVDSRLDQNKSELGVLVLSVSLKVLSNGNSLLDQEVQVLWDLWSKTVGLENSHNLVTGDHLGLVNTVSVSQNNTNLRRGKTLSGVLHDLLNNIVRRQFEPRWNVSRIIKNKLIIYDLAQSGQVCFLLCGGALLQHQVVASDTLVDVFDVVGGGLEMGRRVVRLGDIDMVLGPVLQWLVQLGNAHQNVLGCADDLECGLQLQVRLVCLDDGGDDGQVVALGTNVVGRGNGGNVDVVFPAHLVLRDDDLRRVRVGRVWDRVVQNAHGSDHLLARGLDLLWEIGWVCNHNRCSGSSFFGLDTNKLAIFVQHLVNWRVQHESSAVDRRQSGKSLWKLAQSVQWVNVWRFAVSGNRTKIQHNSVVRFSGRLVQVLIVGPKSHGVANEVLGSPLESVLVVHLVHGGLVEIHSTMGRLLVLVVLDDKLQEILHSSLLKESHQRRRDRLCLVGRNFRNTTPAVHIRAMNLLKLHVTGDIGVNKNVSKLTVRHQKLGNQINTPVSVFAELVCIRLAWLELGVQLGKVQRSAFSSIIPTSVPKPYLKPSANLVEQFQYTPAESIPARNLSATVLFSVTIQSVCLDECELMCEMASSTDWTVLTATSSDKNSLEKSVSVARTVSLSSFWMAFLGTFVSVSRVLLITLAIAWNVFNDSLPPFKIAAFPDLMAKAVMLAITSGRLSKMISNTPTGQVSLVKVKPSSSSVCNVILFNGSSRFDTSRTPSHMESYLPFFERSSRLINEEERWFASASSMSFLLAARISSLAASSPSLILYNASDRSLSESVFRVVDARCACLAMASDMNKSHWRKYFFSIGRRGKRLHKRASNSVGLAKKRGKWACGALSTALGSWRWELPWFWTWWKTGGPAEAVKS
ncbi:hypothetical protein OGAPHI_003030 [Ogataea philodendri]|uniref:Uncharacterized protein n=1 Tax=Ogataea philodendri TaxID=1378263 RepID=A0A9P8T631_9ASCO|nr:uncharacterized protein OGAPHI_003030 [Ogataea philodendri]KAH3667381.1 hypothetical protein OGAPHI_003030 [Ogataea philodendri]